MNVGSSFTPTTVIPPLRRDGCTPNIAAQVKGWYETTLVAVWFDDCAGRGTRADLHAVAVGRLADFGFEFGVGGGGDGESRASTCAADVCLCAGVVGVGLVLAAFQYARYRRFANGAIGAGDHRFIVLFGELLCVGGVVVATFF